MNPRDQLADFVPMGQIKDTGSCWKRNALALADVDIRAGTCKSRTDESPSCGHNRYETSPDLEGNLGRRGGL